MESTIAKNALKRSQLDNALDHFEEQHDIDILSVKPYGSHAKNMAGPQSDYDIMFIFSQEPMAYIEELGNRVGTIHTKRDGIDFQGWNVDKFGSLLKDSNPQCLEFLNSPIEYRHQNDPQFWLNKLHAHANENFKPIALYYHYRDMAKSNYMKYLAPTVHDGDGSALLIQDETEDEWIVNVNENFYNRDIDDHVTDRHIEKDSDVFEKGTNERTVNRALKVLRSTFYAKHVRETHEFPTMDFMQFMEESPAVDTDNQRIVAELLESKQDGNKHEEIEDIPKGTIEAELRNEPDHEELNIRGIDRELVNEFIEEMIVDNE